VKLVLPPAGQVVVWIDDATEAEAEQMTVTLAVPAAAPDTGFTAEASARPRGGAATFPFVGLGLSLLARAARPGQNEAARTTLNGPTVDGEVVQVRMRVLPPADRVVLVMHLQDARGQPMRGRRVDVALEARVRGSVTSGTFTMEADDEGVLRLVADEDFGTMPERTLRLRSRPQDAGEPTEAVVTVPPALSPGVNDLGIVAMLPPPLVCAGLVVDHAGRPVADAELDVRVLPNAAGVPGREPREVRGVHGRSDRTGRFTVRGGTPEGELQLGVRAPGFLPRDGVTFLPGASDLRIELAAAAALAGSVELDELVTAVDVLVELKSGGVTRRARLRVNGARGEFRFDSLEAGTATVAVRLLGEPGSLLVEGIPLQPGEVQRDPRLQEVDLGAGRRAVCFAVVDQDGQPAKDVRIAVLHGGDQRSFEGYMSSCGRGRIVTRARPLDVLVFGAGYRSVRVPDLADGATIELRAPLRVRVRLPAGCPAPTPPFALEARIDPGNAAWPANVSFRFYEGLGGETSGDGTPPWVRGARARIGPGGDAVLDVPEPGTWTLSWRMSRHEGQDRVDRWFQSDPAAIAVRDEAAEQAVTAGPRSEQLEAARARLEAR
jgi:hypothetical protein